MPRNTHFQDYWLTDPTFKLWLRKSDERTAFCVLIVKGRLMWLTRDCT